MPRFDGGVLNPDIQFLRAGEVMNSVKCSLVDFMDERDHRLLQDRIRIYKNRNGNEDQQREYLLLYASEYETVFGKLKRSVWGKEGYKPRNWSGDDAEFTPYALNVGQNAKAEQRAGDNAAQPLPFKRLEEKFRAAGLPVPTAQSMLKHEVEECNNRNAPTAINPLGLRHWEAWEWKGGELRLIEENGRPVAGHCVRNADVCLPQLGVPLWDYKAKDRYSHQNGKAGTIFQDVTVGNCARMPDYSRFALDPTQQAKIDLQLLGTTQGTVFYSQIDATRLGGLQEFIAEGNRQLGAVFPVVNVTGKSSTTFQLTAQLPQTVFVAAPSSPFASGGLNGLYSASGGRLNPGAALALAQNRLDAATHRTIVKREIPTVRAIPAQAPTDVKTKAKLETLKQIQVVKTPPPTVPSELATNMQVVQQSAGDILRLSNEPPSDNKKNEVNASADKLDKAISNLSKYPQEQIKNYASETQQVDLPEVLKSAPTPPAVKAFATRRRLVTTTHIQEKSEPARLTGPQADIVKTQMTPSAFFHRGCSPEGIFRSDDGNEVDYLALKTMLLKIVGEQNDMVTYVGTPDLSLDSINLTSSFQITIDASAGTKHVFRIFPMVVPPQMGIKPDHTHILKVTLQGAKKKSSLNSGRDLEISCIERLQPGLANASNGNSAADTVRFCSSANGRMLEQIAVSLENSKASSAGAGE